VEGCKGDMASSLVRRNHVQLDRILCVSLEVHKYFHLVLIHNGLGEIVPPTFEIDILQSGFEQLCQAAVQLLSFYRVVHSLLLDSKKRLLRVMLIRLLAILVERT
jgi:hypothetical protein